MPTRAILVMLVAVVCGPRSAAAALIVNPAQPITHRVTVQLIETALDNGSSPATKFGNAEQRAHIESAIDTIWAQAGVDVAVLPNIVRFNHTFTYQGYSGSEPRPLSDLTIIRLSAQQQGGIMHPDPLVLNLFFVKVAPGAPPLGAWSVAGAAGIRSNEIAAYIGSNLLVEPQHRDVIASVIAHEIGHNLGLEHTPNGAANLMSHGGTSQQLTSAQINTALTRTNYAQLVPSTLPGDYNGDGVVDSADYIVWRNSYGQPSSGMAADGNGNGSIDMGDYSVWRQNFGQVTGSAAGGVLESAPEPATLGVALLAASSIVLLRTRRSVRRSTARR